MASKQNFIVTLNIKLESNENLQISIRSVNVAIH